MYKSPLHILSGRNLSEINEANLKKWRKELLLRFELENSTTIQIAGKTYDKNEVLQAVESLKAVSNFHVQVFNDKPLLAFLETGDIAFFSHYSKWSFLQNAELVEQIKPYFIPQYSRIINKAVQTPNRDSIHSIKSVVRSGFPMPESYKDEAFAGAHSFFTMLVFKAKIDLQQPFQSGKLLLKKEADELFNLNYIQILGMLPHSFAGLKTSYAILANNFVYEALNQTSNHQKLPKKTIKTLINASKINQYFRPDAQTVRLIKQLEDILDAKSSSGGGGFQALWLIFAFFVFIVRVATVADGCGKSSRSRNYDFNQYNNNRFDYNPKTRSSAAKERSIPVDKDFILGKWSSMTWLAGTSSIQRSVEFLDGSIGRMSYSVYAMDSTRITNKLVELTDEKVICTCQAYFSYTIKNGIYNNQVEFDTKDLNWQSCNNKKLTMLENNALVNAKKKLSDSWSQRIYVQRAENRFALDGTWFKPNGQISKNWKKELQRASPTLHKKLLQKKKLAKINEAIANKFVKATKATNLSKMPKFFVSPDDLSLVFKGRVTEIPMADGRFISNKYYIQPKLWVSPDTTIFSIGQFNNINFIDPKGKRRRGNLKAFQTTDDGFLFGEIK